MGNNGKGVWEAEEPEKRMKEKIGVRRAMGVEDG